MVIYFVSFYTLYTHKYFFQQDLIRSPLWVVKKTSDKREYQHLTTASIHSSSAKPDYVNIQLCCCTQQQYTDNTFCFSALTVFFWIK